MLVVIINVMRVPPILDHQNQEQVQGQIDSQDRKTLNHLNGEEGTFPSMRDNESQVR